MNPQSTFVAVDFETANNQEMICQIGLVVVRNGEAVERISRYVQPPGNQYDQVQMSIHRITPEQTKDAPTFDKVWDEIGHYFIGVTLVSHNHFTEERVLQKNLEAYNIWSIGICTPFVCTCKLHGGRNLKDVCQAYGMPFEGHHDALFDAECCAKFYLNYLNDIRPDYSLISEQAPKIFRSKPKAKSKVMLTQSELDLFAKDHPDSPFANRKVVITGDFAIGRENVEWIVQEKHRGVKVGNFSKKVHYAIIGEEPGPAKMDKLEKLIHDGFRIRKIHEEELMSILSGNWEGCHVDEEVKKDLDFSFEHYMSHHYSPSGVLNPIARKELFFGKEFSGSRDVFRQITGNLGAAGDDFICAETQICVLSDRTLDALRNGEKDETILYIQDYYNQNKSVTFELSFLSEADILQFCKDWCEKNDDQSTSYYYQSYLKSSQKQRNGRS